ncbi:MAG: Holliday junction resolvase RuvX [Cyclobacteriaceae bacterium]
MGRILAIDYGNKRTGIAVTDPLQIIATALDTLPTHLLIDYIRSYVAKEDVEAIVLGWPTNLDNSETDSTAHVRGFHRKLQKEFADKQIHLHDERFTSKMALDAMITGGMTKKNRRKKENVDKVSAVIILQSFLESK